MYSPDLIPSREPIAEVRQVGGEGDVAVVCRAEVGLVK